MIDTQAIRNKILDLAIRGKLTEQFPEDGNAEDLYQQIQEEKAALIKEGKIKKSAKLPEISADDVPFEIPQNWKWVNFGAIITLQSGQDLKATEYNDAEVGIPYLTGASNFDENDNLILNRWTSAPKNLAFENDVLISCKGTVGKIAVLHAEQVHIARQFMAIRTYLVNVDYIKLFMESVVARIKAASKGLIPGIERKDILNLYFPLPPYAEQERIANRVGTLFDLLKTIDDYQDKYVSDFGLLKSKIIDAGIRGELTEQLPEDGTAEELYQQIQAEKDAILKERKGRADKKIKEVEDDLPFDIPSNWKWIRFGEIGLFKKGPFGSALTKAMFVPKGSDTVKVYEQQHAIRKDPYLGTYYITRQYFDDKMNGFEVLPGDVIVSCAGTIGETYILPEGIEQGIINQALMRITLARSIDKRFFQYYFDSNLKASAQSESNGMAITNIPPFDLLKNWYFPLPPLAEQKRIVERIEELLAAMPE